MKEVWKDIEGYKGRYQVSSYGQIKSVHKRYGCVMKQRLHNGYYEIMLGNRMKSYKNHGVHRLMIQAFVDNHENKPFTNHKDGNKLNNHITNLEWVTGAENTQHAYDNGLIVKKKGSDCSHYEGKHSLAKKVIRYNLLGEIIGVYDSASQAARINKTAKYNISRSCLKNGVHLNSKWKYV